MSKKDFYKKELKDLCSVKLEGSALRKKMAALTSVLSVNNYKEKETDVVRQGIRQWKKHGSARMWFRSGDYSFHDGMPRVGNDLRTYDAFYDEAHTLEAGRVLVRPNRIHSYTKNKFDSHIGIFEASSSGIITFQFFDKNEEVAEIALFPEIPFKFHKCSVDIDQSLMNEVLSLKEKYDENSLYEVNAFLDQRMTQEKKNHVCKPGQELSNRELFLQEIMHIRAPYHAPYERPTIPKGVKVYTVE